MKMLLASVGWLGCAVSLCYADTPDTASRNNRYALIIGIGNYTKTTIPALKGVQYDMVSAKRMANSMAIPDQNIVYIRDSQATADTIKTELKQLNTKLQPGDRLFVYYSGHGTRWHDPSSPAGVCTEGLVTSEGDVLSNQEIGKLLEPVAKKTDKMLVFYDACFSGGVVGNPFKTRALTVNNVRFTPKFTTEAATPECFQPSNFKTRSLNTALQQQGGLPQNIVHIAASRPDEVSFDNGNEGGLATTAWRDCLMGEAKDLDGSGAITVDEITQCAQVKLNHNLANQPGILGQHMTIGGNKSFVPAWIKAAFIAPAEPVHAPATPSQAQATTPSGQMPSSDTSQPVTETPVTFSKPVSPAAILAEVHEQRDGAKPVNVSLPGKVMHIGKDKLALSITPGQNGYLYIALAGSDQKSLYLLYPNKLDSHNAVKAGQTITLPRKEWQIEAAGPTGKDTLLIMVTDSPRDLSRLKAEPAGPFMQTLLDESGRSQLQQVLVTSANNAQSDCRAQGGTLRNLVVAKQCSDAFGSALISIDEVK